MPPEPRATYRLQLRPGFGFDEAAEVVPYLAALGVSHLYLSPCLQARPGSSHGYDVVDFDRISEALGGPGGWARLREALERCGLGLLLDIVPNHMATAGRENPWWWDVLESGPASPYASFFDIDWEAVTADGEGLILPVLADHYGRVLERGEILLEREGARFVFRTGEQTFPAAPRSLFEILAPAAERAGSERLAFLGRAFRGLPSPSRTDEASAWQRHRDKEVLTALLGQTLEADPACTEAVDAEVQRIADDPDRLDLLLRQQSYRLAYWRIAARELPYRRFFDIDSLVALRMEEPRVFDATHHLILGWLRKGRLQGVRVDHVDGLRDPRAYLERLRSACTDAWILVEKILDAEEELPADWPVDGTTGYDFLNRVLGLLIDPRGATRLDVVYAGFTGEEGDYRSIAVEKKRQVLRDLLGSDLRRLTELFAEVCRRHRRHRDHTEPALEAALLEVIAQLPVYRTYVRAETATVSAQDEAIVKTAVEAAARRRSDLPGDLFDFLADLLLLREAGEAEGELAMRFQQISAPATAKGIEDTALYCFNRFIALNEVGGDPARFGVGVDEFHEACLRSLARAPRGLLATSTHDTKRSDDVRARLALLSEIPEGWAEAVRRLSALAARHRLDDLPDRNAEYLLYQTLVGAWPLSAERASAYLEKAAREAKVHTSWRRPDPAYEDALRAFVDSVLRDPEFCAALEAFVAPLVEPGRTNSLAQTLLKATAPGVPDFYQGSEVWDLSLVDPDNRRPVDFALRRRLLASLEEQGSEEVEQRSQEGLPKLRVVREALALRARVPDCFGPRGSHVPLLSRGEKREHAVAFARGGGAVVVVPRLVIGLGGNWSDTCIELPEGSWRNVFTGETLAGHTVALAELLRRFPVALLERMGGEA